MGDVIDHFVEKVAVVGDQQQGTRVALEPVFEPDDRIEIEVVGRLVEQQQIRRAHQCLRQVQIHLLVGEPQPGQQLAGTGIGGIAVGAVEFRVQTCQGRAIVGRFGERTSPSST